MTEFNLYLYPGKELKEVLDRHIGAGKKYPLGESLTFVDDKEKSGFTIKEDVTFKAGTKVHLNVWATQNKNSKSVLQVSIADFESGYTKSVGFKKNRPAPKKQSNEDDDVDFNFG